MKRFVVAVMAVVCVSGGSAAFAASVVDIEGRVLVDSGSGFRRVAGSAAVSPGTRVMANPGGAATIVYDNGCREQVAPGAVVTVKSQGACVTGTSSANYALGAVAVGGGVALAIGLSNKSDKNNDKPASP